MASKKNNLEDLIVRCNYVINTTNLIHTRFTFTYTSLMFKVSTCFAHYLPIFRRHYTNDGLVSTVCGCRCGLISWTGCTYYVITSL
jgi:hypothetical protein